MAGRATRGYRGFCRGQHVRQDLLSDAAIGHVARGHGRRRDDFGIGIDRNMPLIAIKPRAEVLWPWRARRSYYPEKQMTFRPLTFLLLLASACANSPQGGTAAHGGAGAANGSAGSSDAEPPGTDCVGERGELHNYFCGQQCTGFTGQRPGVNCGRACIGEPDEVQGANCTPPMPFGGSYGRCREDGEQLEAKIIGAVCCEGLECIGLEHPTAGGCLSDAPPSLFVCSACGDGTCGPSENSCNCSVDCP